MAKNTQARLIKMNRERHLVITPVFRLSFPTLFTPKAHPDDPQEKKAFRLEGIFDSKEAFKEPYKGKKIQTVSMAKAVLNAKIDQWGSDRDKWPKFAYPVFRDGDERKNQEGEIYKGYEGGFWFAAKSGEEFPPRVYSSTGQALTEAEVYGGCYCRAELMARPYAVGPNKGIRFVLLSVMKVKDGEKFGGLQTDLFDFTEAIEGDSEEDDSEEDIDF